MNPMIIAALISGAAGLGSAAFGGAKGKPTEMTSANPEMDQYRQQLMEMVMAQIGKQRPYAQVNPMNLMGANMASQYYYGQPYTHPGYGMGSMMGQGSPRQQMQSPTGAPPGGGMTGAGPMGGMPMGRPQYGPQLQKGANFAV